MENLTRTILLSLALLVSGTGSIWGADFNKGLAAYNSGDFASALQEWTPLAEQGSASAQYRLGVIYRKGQRMLRGRNCS